MLARNPGPVCACSASLRGPKNKNGVNRDSWVVICPTYQSRIISHRCRALVPWLLPPINAGAGMIFGNSANYWMLDVTKMPPQVVYVDVDDTLVRSIGTKRIPIPAAIERVRALHREGAVLYLWSTGGADYARATASELGLSALFAGFLPKPTIVIDDQQMHEWKGFKYERPF